MRQTIRFIEGLVMLMISGIALFYFKLPIAAAVGVFANAGQQNLIEWLKGVIRYKLSECLRQQVVKSNKPGGAMHRAVWMEK